ncbi:DUF2867 domain-containing protein [Microlunatus speluncae]|uniref:DUF2867 domain-containing protein n=1 Tax=Microlunatus speluncae TaxID=2594267 RepID=UPI00126626B0|nr:DUF2867 domain-containing protein [Microlunatus speluncae]
MGLPKSAYTSRPWRMHEIAPEFTVEDVWELPTRGGPEEFPRVVDAIFGSRFPEGAPALVRFLWAARWKLGEWFGLDDEDGGLDARVQSLRKRLPDDLRSADAAYAELGPFSRIFQTDAEFAAELANRTVHTVMHLGWVPDPQRGVHYALMTVLVRPNGRLGAGYLAAIKPLRHLFVYPALLRQIEQQWAAASPTAH